MTPFNENKFFQFISNMQDSTDYLKINELKNQYCYKIYARNAYVGIWVKSKEAFLISRYKVGPNPYLFFEYHWDTGEPFGTAKPIELIEKCPFDVKESNHDNDKSKLLIYLDKLEEDNPIIDGVNSLKSRRISAIKFKQHLSGMRIKHENLEV